MIKQRNKSNKVINRNNNKKQNKGVVVNPSRCYIHETRKLRGRGRRRLLLAGHLKKMLITALKMKKKNRFS